MSETSSALHRAAQALGKQSAKARRQAWGEEEFVRRMKEWGKLGGRPRKAPEAEKGGE